MRILYLFKTMLSVVKKTGGINRALIIKTYFIPFSQKLSDQVDIQNTINHKSLS